ncbi:MAG: nucleotidyl transferase AbiEii/AbiGii toxin family protein [Verrucomicrobia bacterium]|nr:nucleotidyl transferase AbiEii/AbiGii toxin family protein [Verrucomicrobiota bacterium]
MNTTFKTATDFRKSLEVRLQGIASKTKEDLQRLRRKVAFDRLLARIFSQEQGNFFLKGGYAMELRIGQARATKDIDLTCILRAKNESELLRELILQELQTLAQNDLKDHFVYQIGKAQIDLENVPYGGARYPVSSLIDGKLFVRFQLDVGADIVINQIENVQGTNWLGFCDIPSPIIPMISIEQQFAEKLHTYTLPRGDKINSRAKDLIDMVLLLKMKNLKLDECRYALERVFKTRNTHSLPEKLGEPPLEWQIQFIAMAAECGFSSDMGEAFKAVVRFYEKLANK